MMCRILALALAPASLAAQHPNFEGIWNSATATPLERPERLKGKEFFTPQEAAEWERQAAARTEEPTPEVRKKTFGSYNVVFYETGTKSLKSLRTSIITDPPDGRIPALTPAAGAEKSRRLELLRHPRIATDLGLQDQCIVFPTAVAPMRPYSTRTPLSKCQTR